MATVVWRLRSPAETTLFLPMPKCHHSCLDDDDNTLLAAEIFCDGYGRTTKEEGARARPKGRPRASRPCRTVVTLTRRSSTDGADVVQGASFLDRWRLLGCLWRRRRGAVFPPRWKSWTRCRNPSSPRFRLLPSVQPRPRCARWCSRLPRANRKNQKMAPTRSRRRPSRPSNNKRLRCRRLTEWLATTCWRQYCTAKPCCEKSK